MEKKCPLVSSQITNIYMIETHQSPCQSILQSLCLISLLCLPYLVAGIEDVRNARKMNFRKTSFAQLLGWDAISIWLLCLPLMHDQKHWWTKKQKLIHNMSLTFRISKKFALMEVKSHIGLWKCLEIIKLYLQQVLDESNWAQNAKFSNKRNITYHLGLKMNTIFKLKIICRTVVLCLNKWLGTFPVHGMNCSDTRFSFFFLFDVKNLQYLKRMKPNMQHVPRKIQWKFRNTIGQTSNELTKWAKEKIELVGFRQEWCIYL